MKIDNVPVVGFAAYSGTGKTTLLVKLIAILHEQGYRVGVIKHAHHTFEIDQPGKDSFELRKAGASQILVGSKKRWALIVESVDKESLSLHDIVHHFDTTQLDLILVEGFKPEAIPKIELTRPSLGNPLFFTEDDNVIAVATNAELPIDTSLPVLDINRPDLIADFIIDQFLQTDKINTDNT
jgi:molybdopterin-guanine dinucleotide biosynthesis protein B